MEPKIEKKAELKRSITIELQGNSFNIAFPNMGQIIDIETNKISYANGRYSQLINSNIISSNIAKDLVEMAATFTVLIPDFQKIFKLNSIFELNPIDATEFVTVYKEEVFPWYSEWLITLKIEPKSFIEEESTSND